MPIYEYICEQCQKRAEIIQKFDEGIPEECPLCGAKDSLKKAVVSSAFHLKGGGWYTDLYSSTKPSAKANDSSVSSTDTKKEEKPEKKTKKDDSST